MATSNNDRFLRCWWEVSKEMILPIKNKWFGYSKVEKKWRSLDKIRMSL